MVVKLFCTQPILKQGILSSSVMVQIAGAHDLLRCSQFHLRFLSSWRRPENSIRSRSRFSTGLVAKPRPRKRARQLSRRSATFLAPSPSIPLSKNQLEALISLCYTLDQTARREILEQMLYRGTSLWSEGVVDCFVLQLFTAWLPNPCRGDAEKQRELDRKRVHAMFKAQGGGLKYAVATARQQSALGGGSGGQPFFSTTPAPVIAAQWCKRPRLTSENPWRALS